MPRRELAEYRLAARFRTWPQTGTGVLAGFALVLGMLASPAFGQPRWNAVTAGSSLEYFASFEGAPAPGRFNEFDVCLVFDPADTSRFTLQVRVAVASATMGNSEINQAIRQTEWFDVDRFPQAVFLANHVTTVDSTHFIASGELTLKGVSRPLQLPFSWNGDTDKAELRGSIELSRGDFSIGSGEWAEADSIGQQVRVDYSVWLERDPNSQ